MAVVRRSLCEEKPEVVREIWRLLSESRKAAVAAGADLQYNPFGVEANRRNLAVAIDQV